MFSKYEIQVVASANDTKEVAEFVKKYHYLHSLSRGNKHVFVLKIEGIIQGVALFGTPVGTNVVRKYGSGTLELKRFVLNDCPKNTASWFMSKCMRWLKANSETKRVISYADPTQGHEGIIYQASNFKYLGKQAKFGSGYTFIVGAEHIHQRAAYQKGTFTYDLVKLAEKHGKLKKVAKKPKHIYLYELAEKIKQAQDEELEKELKKSREVA